MSSKSRGLGLNIFGGSGFFNTTSLIIQSENGSSIPHKTNWDTSLSGPFVTNSTDIKNFELKMKDYSKSQYDSYYNYGINDGNYLQYNYDMNWYVNDIDMEDDIAVATTKNWNSIEKNTYDIGPSGITVDAIVDVGIITYSDPSYQGCTIDTWEIYVDTFAGNRADGTITFTYYPKCGHPEVASTYLLSIVRNNEYGPMLFWSQVKPTYTTTGTANKANIQITFAGQAIVPGTIPDCKDLLGNQLGYPIEYSAWGWTCAQTNITVDCPYTSFNIKGFADILQKQKFLDSHLAYGNGAIVGRLYANTPMGGYDFPSLTNVGHEFPDYSDIFIEIDYVKGELGDYFAPIPTIVVPTGDPNIYGPQYESTRRYSFGGFIDTNTYYDKMIDQYNSYKGNAPWDWARNFTDNKWYMVYRGPNGDYEFITLDTNIQPSSIIDTTIKANLAFDKYKNIPINKLEASGLPLKYFMKRVDDGDKIPATENSPNNETLYLGGIALTTNNIIATTGVRMIKYINHPNCGKADIYIKKTGKVQGITSNVVLSSGHGLSTGDSIKFSSALNNSISGITNLNGTKYVDVGSENTFALYYDANLTTPSVINNLKTVSGINWTAIGSKNWDYKSTLYSPMGKNGYGFTPQVRLVDESSIVNGVTMFDRAMESSTFIDPNSSVIKPQSVLNNWVSWNNYYPFVRANSETTMSDPLYNGNKFGSDVQIQKIKDNKYLLMVTEPGAEISFSFYNGAYAWNVFHVNENIFQPPVYLPQGRIHFYTITKDPFNIEYLTSVSHSGNPWEAISYFYQIARDGQYQVDIYSASQNLDLARGIYNRTGDNYWLGGRFYAWNKPYAFESNYQMNIPNYPLYAGEFGFLDSFGKSAAFDVDASSVYCVASTNVKSAGFDNNTRMLYVDALSQAFSLDFTANFNSLSRVSALSGIVHQSNYYTSNIDSQLIEIDKFALNVDFDESKLFIGWPSYARGQESIFIYDRVGSGYQPFQTLTQVGDQNDFGNYFVADNNMLITNAYNKMYGAYIPENPPFIYNSLYIYRQDPFDQKYYLMQNISPTMDLSNPIYNGMNSQYYTTGVTNYTRNTNLSYDNTTGNSATQLLDLQGRYDIYHNSLVMRDFNEFIYFEFDGKNRKFTAKNHKMINDVNLLSENAVLRMRPSNASYIESYPTSEFIESLDVLEGSTYFSNMRILNESYPRPTYLPLFLKSIEGAPSTGIILQSRGHAPFNSGSILYTQGPIPTGSGMNMFMKMPDLKASGMDLFMKQYLPFETGTTLYTKDQQGIQVMTLHMNPEFNNRIPLFAKVHNYKYNDENGNPIEVDELGNYWQGMYLNIVNRHTGVPNASGYLNLSLRTYESDDTANILNLVINQDYPTSTTGINLFMPDPTGTNRFSIKNDLYLKGPQFIRGTGVDNSLNLVIRRTPEAAMPLTVYNTYTASGLNAYVKGTNLASSGATLYASGAGLPTGSMTVYVDGTVLY